jgi:hypothetical protein
MMSVTVTSGGFFSPCSKGTPPLSVAKLQYFSKKSIDLFKKLSAEPAFLVLLTKSVAKNMFYNIFLLPRKTGVT